MYIQSGTQSPIRDAIGTSRTFGAFHENTWWFNISSTFPSRFACVCMRAPLVIAKLVGKGNHYQVRTFYF